MALQTLKLDDLASQFLTNFDVLINQDTPANEKAFNNVLAGAEAMLAVQVAKSGDMAAKDAFVISASETGLIAWGNEYNLPRTPAGATVLTATHPGTNGTVIPIGTRYTGVNNGLKYVTNAETEVTAGNATLSLTCKTAGIEGNLEVADTLEIETQIAGLTGTTATITIQNTLGTDQENLEVWRQRLLDKRRDPGSGSTPAAYRNFGQEVPGVARVYPYKGNLTVSPNVLKPILRTLFVETTTEIDPDGLANSTILNAVRSSVTYDSDGIARQDLGLTDETLFTASIYRTTIYVTIDNLQWETGTESITKTALGNAVSIFLRTRRPWIQGLDPDFENYSEITTHILSAEIAPVLAKYGASCNTISFGLTNSTTVGNLTAAAGQLFDLYSGGIVYT